MPTYEEVNSLKSYALNDLDRIMVAQHYGLATRLIDWSKNPLVALYFATERVDAGGGECSVFMLCNPQGAEKVAVSDSDSFVASLTDEQNRMRALRQFSEEFQFSPADSDRRAKIHRIIEQFTSSELIYPPLRVHPENLAMHLSLLPEEELLRKLTRGTVNALAPISAVQLFGDCLHIVEALPMNPRIKNQQGVFMFSNDVSKPAIGLDEFSEINTVDSDCLSILEAKDKDAGMLRIDIPKEFASQIHDELNAYGITRDFIYPELASFTAVMQKRIVEKVSNEYSLKKGV